MFPDISKIMAHAEDANKKADIRHEQLMAQNEQIISLLTDILFALSPEADDVQTVATVPVKKK